MSQDGQNDEFFLDRFSEVCLKALEKVETIKMKTNVLGLNISLEDFDLLYSNMRRSFASDYTRIENTIKELANTMVSSLRLTHIHCMRACNSIVLEIRRKFQVESLERKINVVPYEKFDAERVRLEEKFLTYRKLNISDKRKCVKEYYEEVESILTNLKKEEAERYEGFENHPNDYYMVADQPKLAWVYWDIMNKFRADLQQVSDLLYRTNTNVLSEYTTSILHFNEGVSTTRNNLLTKLITVPTNQLGVHKYVKVPDTAQYKPQEYTPKSSVLRNRFKGKSKVVSFANHYIVQKDVCRNIQEYKPNEERNYDLTAYLLEARKCPFECYGVWEQMINEGYASIEEQLILKFRRLEQRFQMSLGSDKEKFKQLQAIEKRTPTLVRTPNSKKKRVVGRKDDDQIKQYMKMSEKVGHSITISPTESELRASQRGQKQYKTQRKVMEVSDEEQEDDADGQMVHEVAKHKTLVKHDDENQQGEQSEEEVENIYNVQAQSGNHHSELPSKGNGTLRGPNHHEKTLTLTKSSSAGSPSSSMADENQRIKPPRFPAFGGPIRQDYAREFTRQEPARQNNATFRGERLQDTSYSSRPRLQEYRRPAESTINRKATRTNTPLQEPNYYQQQSYIEAIARIAAQMHMMPEYASFGSSPYSNMVAPPDSFSRVPELSTPNQRASLQPFPLPTSFLEVPHHHQQIARKQNEDDVKQQPQVKEENRKAEQITMYEVPKPLMLQSSEINQGSRKEQQVLSNAPSPTPFFNELPKLPQSSEPIESPPTTISESVSLAIIQPREPISSERKPMSQQRSADIEPAPAPAAEVVITPIDPLSHSHAQSSPLGKSNTVVLTSPHVECSAPVISSPQPPLSAKQEVAQTAAQPNISHSSSIVVPQQANSPEAVPPQPKSSIVSSTNSSQVKPNKPKSLFASNKAKESSIKRVEPPVARIEISYKVQEKPKEPVVPVAPVQQDSSEKQPRSLEAYLKKVQLTPSVIYNLYCRHFKLPEDAPTVSQTTIFRYGQTVPADLQELVKPEHREFLWTFLRERIFLNDLPDDDDKYIYKGPHAIFAKHFSSVEQIFTEAKELLSHVKVVIIIDESLFLLQRTRLSKQTSMLNYRHSYFNLDKEAAARNAKYEAAFEKSFGNEPSCKRQVSVRLHAETTDQQKLQYFAGLMYHLMHSGTLQDEQIGEFKPAIKYESVSTDFDQLKKNNFMYPTRNLIDNVQIVPGPQDNKSINKAGRENSEPKQDLQGDDSDNDSNGSRP